MINLPTAYSVLKEENGGYVRYYFESEGALRIKKVIEFRELDAIGAITLFNFGFGDLDEDTGGINDDLDSNNGDARKVFSTVLNAIPLFFQSKPNTAIWVQGSDSITGFEVTCRLTCRKRCLDRCKNMGRRIRIYRRFIDQNLQSLKAEYKIYGLFEAENYANIYPYQPNKEYDALIVLPKQFVNL